MPSYPATHGLDRLKIQPVMLSGGKSVLSVRHKTPYDNGPSMIILSTSGGLANRMQAVDSAWSLANALGRDARVSLRRCYGKRSPDVVLSRASHSS
jgi:hypothetical protein